MPEPASPAAVPASAVPSAPVAPAPLPAPAAVTPPPLPPAVAAPQAELELRVPAGVSLQPEFVAGIRGLAGGPAKLTSAQAQAVLDFGVSEIQRLAAADAATNAARVASWEADLARDYPGPERANATARIDAFVKTRLPALHDYLMVQGAHKFPELFRYFDAAARQAAETGNIRTAATPAPNAAADPNDWSAIFTHPTSKAALAAESR